MGLTKLSTLLRGMALALVLMLAPGFAPALAAESAALDIALLAPLAGGDTEAKLRVIAQLGQMPDQRATRILEALGSGRLRGTPSGELFIIEADQSAADAVTGATRSLPADANSIMINNRLRRAIAGALAVSQLYSEHPRERLAAAQAVQRGSDPAMLPAVEQALASETDAQVRQALGIARAVLQLKQADGAFRSILLNLLVTEADGRYAEPDEEVREEAAAALARIDSHLTKLEWAGNLFYGISLGSVLLLAALGLAITFGLMGVINMAHGELLMIGAYVTYLTQLAFRQYASAWSDWYIVAALPLAFLVSGAVGMLLERSVIRWLYGRPLETLLATWGISLILIQAVRTLFGAQNVEVSNPTWMTGGVTVMGGLSLSYNRIAIIVFALLVVFFVWLLLNHTRLGLFIRAITQNRRMADCVGVPTGRIDMLAFGLGSGIAGLGGVALSQLSNVGPDLGRGYIVDSFMVVVLGGVGQLAGAVTAALGLGVVSKFIEPWTGAVIAKITILVLIVLFIQKRPQGLFAPRGRSVE